jgi:hypothetical protein
MPFSVTRAGSSRRAPVSDDEDNLYFLHRAEAEIELAQRAQHPKAVAAHYHLAQSYLDLAYRESDPEPPHRETSLTSQ